MGYVPAHLEQNGRLPPQHGSQVSGASDEEEDGCYVGLPPTDGGDGGDYGRGRPTGGGYLCHPLPEHGFTIYCNHTHYETVSAGGVTPVDDVVEAVVGGGVP